MSKNLMPAYILHSFINYCENWGNYSLQNNQPVDVKY